MEYRIFYILNHLVVCFLAFAVTEDFLNKGTKNNLETKK